MITGKTYHSTILWTKTNLASAKELGRTPLRYLTVDFNFLNFGHKLDVVGCFCTFYV